jgi:hypothetical protein
VLGQPGEPGGRVPAGAVPAGGQPTSSRAACAVKGGEDADAAQDRLLGLVSSA